MEYQKGSDKLWLKWLDQSLENDEVKSFTAKPEIQQFQRVLDSVDTIIPPQVDEDLALSQIEQKIERRIIRHRTIRRNILISTALLICAILIGYSLWPRKLKITAKVGQPMAHLLPDGSSVNLNATSTLLYNAEQFTEQRKLQLEGEAFFEVKKGNNFLVETPQGTVEVLGTSFNVIGTEQLLMVSCKTGKVKVSFGADSQILEPGQRIRIELGEIIFQDQVSIEHIAAWKGSESIFESVPLSDVIEALENQFNLNIRIDKSLSEDIFTGSFIHADRQKALEMVFLPMDLKYEVEGSGTVKVTQG